MKLLWGLLPAFVVLERVLATRELQTVPSDPAFYDNLRTSDALLAVNSSQPSAVYRVTTQDDNEYRLADLKAFLPLSDNSESPFWGALKNDAFSALLASYHFNNVEQSPILSPDDLQNCQDLRLTMEIFDSEWSPIETTRTFTSVLQRPISLEVPPTAAVVGAARSAVTSPLAILTGVNDIPQVSHASTAVDFDVKEQFPLFGRTVTSSVGTAAVAVEYFKSINSENVAILFVTDSYGSSLQKAFQDAASKANITTEPIPFPFYVTEGSDEARNAIQTLKRIQYRHVFAIFFDTQFDPIMKVAKEMGAVGEDYLYIFPGFDIAHFQTYKLAADSPLVSVYNGLGFLQMQSSVSRQAFLAGDYMAPPFEADPKTGFERFRVSWRDALKDEAFVAFVQDKIPASLDSVPGFNRSLTFAADPGNGFSPYLYDAVTGLGLAMCRTVEEFFLGPQVYEQWLQTDFEGASGHVKVDNVTGTRDYLTMSFGMWNTRVIGTDPEGNALIQFMPSLYFGKDQWLTNPYAEEFIYADNSTAPPNSLPDVLYNYNYIGESGRIVGYTLMAITVTSSLLSLVWLVWYREKHVVVSAQPLFLFMVSVGTIVMASTIVPLGLEEPVVATPVGLDMACMSTPWLYIVGTTLAFSALFAKTKGVHLAYLNPELDFIHVSAFDVLFFFFVYFVLNFVVLITWTTVSPLEWDRIQEDATDKFNRNTDSYAVCSSEHSLPFVIVLAVVNIGMLILGNYWAYKSRNIETEYNESSYIGVSMAATLQAWTMGIPILIVVWDSPPAKFYVSSGIIFVTSQAILCLVYVPKILALRQVIKRDTDPKRLAYASFQERSKVQESDEDEDEDNSGGDRNNPTNQTPESEVVVDQNPQDPVDGDPSAQYGPMSADLTSADLVAAENEPAENPEPQFEQSKSADFKADGRRRRPTKGADNAKSWSPASRPSGSIVGAISSFTQAGRVSLFSGGAVCLKNAPENLAGIKVLHNPRASRNLELSGGLEMSRKQLDYLKGPGVEGDANGNPDDAAAEAGGPLEHVEEDEEEDGFNGDGEEEDGFNGDGAASPSS